MIETFGSPLDAYLGAVEAMAAGKTREHGCLKTPDCGRGLLLEELAEYFDEIRKKEKDRNLDRIAEELIDIGVCVLRTIECTGTWLAVRQAIDQAENRILGNHGGPHSLHAAYSQMERAAREVCDVRNRWDMAYMVEILGVACVAYVDIAIPAQNTLTTATLTTNNHN